MGVSTGREEGQKDRQRTKKGRSCHPGEELGKSASSRSFAAMVHDTFTQNLLMTGSIKGESSRLFIMWSLHSSILYSFNRVVVAVAVLVAVVAVAVVVVVVVVAVVALAVVTVAA